jgi:hypothetical protein
MPVVLEIFSLRNPTSITANFTIPSGWNNVSVGPITIASGVTVTVSGDWSII